MIVVTGSCRTGTSLAMQMLSNCGVPLTGYAYHDDFPDVDLNPHGYWELPISETVVGINHREYCGTAIKLFGYQLMNTHPKNVRCIIVCYRDSEDAIRSTIKLLKKQGDRFGLKADMDTAAKIYELNYMAIDNYLRTTNLPHYNILYKDSIKDRKQATRKLFEFVESTVTVNN